MRNLLENTQKKIQSEAKLVLRIKKDPWFFLTNFCYTKDEHDLRRPYKLFPRHEYLRRIVDIWMAENLLLIPKSRKMLVTWLFVCLNLWLISYHRGSGAAFISEKEDDSDSLIERAYQVYIRLRCPHPELKRKHLLLISEGMDSQIKGFSQNPNIVRMHTFTSAFVDEGAFQGEMEKLYAALKPTIDGGGKLVIASTSNGKEIFYRLCNDIQ